MVAVSGNMTFYGPVAAHVSYSILYLIEGMISHQMRNKHTSVVTECYYLCLLGAGPFNRSVARAASMNVPTADCYPVRACCGFFQHQRFWRLST